MSDVTDITLPPGFEALMPFADWALPRETDRMLKRADARQPEIVRFRDAMMERLDMIVGHLNAFPLNDMPVAEGHLMSMLLSLAEVAPAIEFYRQPRVIDGFDPRRFLPVEDFVLRPKI